MSDVPPRDGTPTTLWKRLDTLGLERAAMRSDGRGWTLYGTILLLERGAPFEAHYRLDCDRAWATQSVVVELSGPDGDASLRLEVKDGRWYEGDLEIKAVRGCTDIDLEWSPSTNTLPIRRLGLAVGESRDVTAAWVQFPGLTLEPLRQEYHRLTERRYRYSSSDGAFVGELEVDEHGRVTRYGDIWSREA